MLISGLLTGGGISDTPGDLAKSIYQLRVGLVIAHQPAHSPTRLEKL